MADFKYKKTVEYDYYTEPTHLAGTTRHKMPNSQRAKQFMPFAAVSGLEEALEEKRRLHEEKMKAEDGYEKLIEE